MERFWIICVLILVFVGFSAASEHEFDEYTDSLVSVKETGEGLMKGSGFVYSSDGYIVTNNHVASENSSAVELEVRFNQTGEWRPVSVIGRDPETDLAVLKADNLPIDVGGLQISDSSLEIGQEVVILGNSPATKETIISGEVVEVDEDVTVDSKVELENLVVISASVSPGNSGSPVLISGGDVVGVLSARDLEEEVGFAIPGPTLRDVIPRLIQNQTAEAELVNSH